jgi:NADPH:quinone reductase-like Zn-dependent oxidoreductase
VFVYRAGSARPGEGTAAQYVVVPRANAIRVPDPLPTARIWVHPTACHDIR